MNLPSASAATRCTHPHRLLVPLWPGPLAAVLGALALLLVLAGAPARAQEGGGAGGVSEDVLSGFEAPLPGEAEEEGGTGESGGADGGFEGGFAEEFGTQPQEAPEEPAAAPWWELDGFLRLDGATNYAHEAPPPGRTDHRGLSRLRLALQLELSLELGGSWESFLSGQAFRNFAYQINGEEQYRPGFLDVYQEEAEVREAWVLGTPLPSLDLKVGRQIVVWGKSDNIRIVDVLNPLDLREPGLTDLEDLRLPVGMTRVDYYLGPWALTGIAVHEVRFNKEPVPGSDFFPFPEDTVLPPEEIPEDTGSNTEYGAALSGIFSGWDLAFYWAEVFEDEAHVADRDGNPANGLQPVRRHARVHMAGAAVSAALGNWLLKSEAARFSGLRFANVPRRRYVRGSGLVGVEYSGFTDTTLGFEAAVSHIFDHEPRLSLPPDQQHQDTNQYVLSYRGSYLREKLDLVALVSAFGAKAEQGTLQRYQATYELATALDLTGGVAVYTAGAGENFLLNAAQDNDRVFFDLKWSF